MDDDGPFCVQLLKVRKGAIKFGKLVNGSNIEHQGEDRFFFHRLTHRLSPVMMMAAVMTLMANVYPPIPSGARLFSAFKSVGSGDD